MTLEKNPSNSKSKTYLYNKNFPDKSPKTHLTEQAVRHAQEREWISHGLHPNGRPKNSSVTKTTQKIQVNTSHLATTQLQKRIRPQTSMGALRNSYLKDKKIDKNDQKTQNALKGQVMYRCSGCEFELFSKTNINYHQEPKEEKILCNSYFVEKMPWMNFDAKSSSFKLNCPRCKDGVGECKIGGLMCSCGYWQVPAFKLFKNKTEEFIQPL
jgi:hypothetical protein